MNPFIKHTGIAACMDRANVDTDQIIPKQFLKRVERTGFGEFLFFDWRYLADGRPNPDFELNQPKNSGATVLVAGKNFGSGSSREHAPWSLLDFGFRVIIAPSYADIFYNNCFQNGVLPVVLTDDEVRQIFVLAQGSDPLQIAVDLEQQLVTAGNTFSAKFAIDPFRKHCLLNGLDAIGLSLQHADEISRFETHRPAWMREFSTLSGQPQQGVAN